MSDDELEKLAAQMRNMAPSDTARRRGMDAAMAAFNMEFASESAAQTGSIEEKNSQPSQGLNADARPTGQSIRTGRVPALGSNLMKKLSDIFTFTTKTPMLMGSCAAALIAGLIILPNISDLSIEDKLALDAPAAVAIEEAPAAPRAEAAAEEIIVTARKREEALIEAPASAAIADSEARIAKEAQESSAAANQAAPDIQAAPSPVAPAPAPAQSGGEIRSISKAHDQVRQEAIYEAPPPVASAPAIQDAPLPVIPAPEFSINRLAPLSNAQPHFVPPPPVIERQSASTPAVPAPQSITTQQAGGYVLEEVPAEYKIETKTIITKEATSEIVKLPPVFETVAETIVVTPQTVDYVTIPAEYEWVDGEIEGGSVEYETTPAEYETVAEPVVVQEASTELVTIPATFNTDGTIATPAQTQERVIPSVTKLETRRVVKTPASTVERFVPYEIKDGKTRVPVKPATTIERTVPAVTKQVSRRVVKTPASVQERVFPAGIEREVQVRTVINPQRFYLRDDDGNVVREFASRDEFEKYHSNLTTSVQEKPVSTFSVDVDTTSYSFLRASINRGELPPRSAIRLEELINYFSYDYEPPTSSDEPFKANVTVTPTPWNADTKLMHIGIKGYVPPATEKPRSNIVFLIDTSGSMNQTNKLPLLINSFKLLVNTLDEDDTISIVTYAGSAGTVLEPTPASDKDTINAALNRLYAGGSTAGAAGLELAYNKAQESFDKDGINRVILATDGDFNVGFSSPDEMKTFIEEKRETGIFLSVLGFGNGNYKDDLMQSLAQNGNGVAAYIDNLAEANKVLANEAGSALITIAKDVKIQVEFNPDTISEYRLIGYETRALKREDFNNDKVDAGDIGAGHTVTAIYELTPVGSPAQTIDPLRYASEQQTTTGSDEFAFVKIRHKLPNSDESTLQTFPVGPDEARNVNRASDDMRFATAVAAVGQKLRGDTPLEGFSYEDAIELALSAKGEDEHGYRAEFIQLVRLIQSLDE